MIYNLVEEPWIPVLWADGSVKRVGIEGALTRAHHIRCIAATNPMDRVAIVRFLLALLYWCKGNPPASTAVAPGDSFPVDWFSKLDDNKDCFNLLGDGKRFYQYKKEGDEALTANYLVHEIPTGSNFQHFRHSTDGIDGLCPACCAMGLLRLPLFSTSGGRGKPPGINQKPPIYAIPLGCSLAETLRLSWQPVSALGMPAWEQADLRLPKTGEVPLLTGLTWLPRRVWLDDPQQSTGRCISCGREDRLILRSVFAAIGSTKTGEGGTGRIWRDPHVIYEVTGKGDVAALHAGNALDASDAAAGQWARTLAGIYENGTATGASLVGFATVQNDKYLEATEHSVSFVCHRDQREELTGRLDMWQKETSRLRLARKMWPSDEMRTSVKHVEILPLVAAIRPHVEDKVSAKAGELLGGSDEAWRRAAGEYRPMMEIIAKSLSPGFTTAAIQRRKQIAEVLPDMRREIQQADKPRGRKRGAK